MFIALINGSTYVEGETVEDIMDISIMEGHYTDNQDFLDKLESISIYELPDKPLIISGEIPKVKFYIELPE